MSHLLIVDDEEASSRTLKLFFERKGMEVETAISAEEGMKRVEARQPDVVVSDIRMPGRGGLSLLADLHIHYPEIPVIMVTAFHDMDSTIAAMRGGAIDYVPKPIDLDELEDAVNKALSMHRSSTDNTAVELGDENIESGIIGKSLVMKDLFKAIGLFSRSRVPVLIQGEVGTGKSLVGRAIHDASGDPDLTFMLVDCTDHNDERIEDILTGRLAESAGEGKPENTESGTLYFEDVHSLSMRMQGKLVHFLEKGLLDPPAKGEGDNVDQRIIASSSADLSKKIEEGTFREDLFYALSPFSVVIPPLRERREDIPDLVEHQLAVINRNISESIRKISSDAMDILCAYDWPGNVGQLTNVLTKAAVIAPGDTITGIQIAEELEEPGWMASPSGGDSLSDVSLKDLEREHIQRVLTATGWHKGKACEILGISRPRLERRIAEYGFTRDS